ncbi:MAG: MFS transporter [Propionivibrio sp.]
MPLIESRHRALFLALFTVFALFGMSMIIIGATLPKILADYQWSYLTAGLVLGANAVAYFLATFAAGYLVKHWGAKRTVVLGVLLDAVGLAFFAATPDVLTNILLAGLIGLGNGCIEISINWATLRIDSRNTGRPMSLMHGAFAVGAIIGALAVSALISSGLHWTGVYRGAAAIFAVLTVLMLWMPMPVTAHQPAGHEVATRRLAAHPAYWLSFFALFVYVGVELGVSNWVAEYFVAVFAWSPAAGAMLVSLFWAGLLAGRFGVPLLYTGARQDLVLVWLSALATLAILLLSALGFAEPGRFTNHIGQVLVFFAGLGCSIYYPAVITLLGKCFPHAQSQAIGFAATGGGVGAFVFPFLMSALSERWGIRVGFATYGVFAIAMTAVAVSLAVAAAKERSAAALADAGDIELEQGSA